MKLGFASLVIGVASLASIPCSAQIRVRPGDDLRVVLSDLGPGDDVVFEDGDYTLTSRVGVRARGTPENPVVIRAADGASPHIQRAGDSFNVWDVDEAHDLTIRGLRFSGGHAGVAFHSAVNVAMEDCEVYGTAAEGIAFRSDGSDYSGVRVLRSHVHDTGGDGGAGGFHGIVLGCSDGGCRATASSVEWSWVHGVGRGGSPIVIHAGEDNYLSDNVVDGGGLEGAPCVAVGRRGASHANTVERNLLVGCADEGILARSGVSIRNNIVLMAGGMDGISVSPSPIGVGDVMDVVLTHNTVVSQAGDAIALRGLSGRAVIANNALYSQSGRALYIRDVHPSLVVEGNVGGGAMPSFEGGVAPGDLAGDFIGASFSGTLPNDVFPRVSGALRSAGIVAHSLPVDFNGHPRAGGVDVGAYTVGDGTNPGWVLTAGFKERVSIPMMDAGTADMDAGVVDIDGGEASMDSGMSTDGGEADGGRPLADAGGPGPRDTGVAPGPDAAMARDAAPNRVDASQRLDAGFVPEDSGGGCRAAMCGRTAGGRTLLVFAAVLLGARRRRRRVAVS